MSSSSAALKSSKRLRRENRRFGEAYERISAAVAVTDSKAHARNPTRYVPDLAGFSGLAKNEMKNDTKAIAGSKTACPVVDSDDEDKDDYDETIKVSMRPPANPSSSALKKKRRLLNWITNPPVIEKELTFWQTTAEQAKHDFDTYTHDKECWNESFDVTRRILTDATKDCTLLNHVLRHTGNEMYQLYMKERTENPSSYVAKKRKQAPGMWDIIDELDYCQNAIVDCIDDYEALVTEQLEAKEPVPGLQLPCTTISIDELEYPEDRQIWYKGKCITLKSPSPANVAVKANSTDSKRQEIEDALEMKGTEVYPSCVAEERNGTNPKDTAKEDKGEKAEEDSTANGKANGPKDTKDSKNEAKRSTTAAGNTRSNGSIVKSKIGDGDDKSSNEPVEILPAESKRDELCSILATIDEIVRLNDDPVGEADYIFEDREDQNVALIDSIIDPTMPSRLYDSGDFERRYGTSGGTTGTGGKPAVPMSQEELAWESKATPFMALSTEEQWAKFIDGVSERLQQQSKSVSTRSKKRKSEKGTENPTQLSANIRGRIQRGVPLLYSVLSNNEDRVIGTLDCNTIFGGVSDTPSNGNSAGTSVNRGGSGSDACSGSNGSNGDASHSGSSGSSGISGGISGGSGASNAGFRIDPINIPYAFKREESNALERCNLQSTAATLELKIRQRQQANLDLERLLRDSSLAYQKVRNNYSQAIQDDLAEKMHIQQDLVFYGISSSAPEGVARPAGTVPHANGTGFSKIGHPVNGSHGAALKADTNNRSTTKSGKRRR